MVEDMKPVWKKQEDIEQDHEARCGQGVHLWGAHFYLSGRLAYWACVFCGEMDREFEKEERLEWFNGWIENPPKLIVRGERPTSSDRSWETADGCILTEEAPSSIHFVGLEIPELDEAYTYLKCDQDGGVLEKYEPLSERFGPYSDHYWLTRYRVVGAELVKTVSHCFEESTLDVPSAGKPKKTVVLGGLKPISGGED